MMHIFDLYSDSFGVTDENNVIRKYSTDQVRRQLLNVLT